MIRASLGGGDEPMALLGLTEGNINRLKNGQPIKATLKSCGVDLPGSVAIVYGQTEYHIEQELRQAGLMDDRTKTLFDRQQAQETAIQSEYDWILIVTVGLPRSGKTTWAKSQAWPIVNPDAIRLAIHGERFNAQAEPYVWVIAKTMVQALFLAGHKIVILDATNTTHKRREAWVSAIWETFFKVIDTPKEICLARAQQEGDEEIIPVIERMAAQFEPLPKDEKVWPDGG